MAHGRRHRWSGAAAAVLLLLAGGATASASETVTAADGGAQVRPVFASVLDDEQLCELGFLEHLGWRFHIDAGVTELTVRGGHPARHDTLAAAQAAGTLRVLVPPGLDAEQARAAWPQLATLADAHASREAYKHRLAVATRRATARLSKMTEESRFVFPEILGLVHSPVFVFHMPKTEWHEEEKMYFATRSATRAIEEFFRLGATAECYTGQTLALFTTQYELFGPDWFDVMFDADEIVVGRPHHVIDTRLLANVKYERPYVWRALLVEPSRQRMDPILALAPHGRTAFVGLAGVVLNQDPDAFTNDNCIIVSISQRALDTLAANGGTDHLAREAGRVWEQANKAKGLLSFLRASECDAAEREVDALLAQPIFREFMVYVHPDGVVPLGDILRKKIPDADTPVTLRVNMNGLDDAFYQRFRAAYRRGCLARRGPVAPAEGQGGG
jgi:hypothetical protein